MTGLYRVTRVIMRDEGHVKAFKLQPMGAVEWSKDDQVDPSVQDTVATRETRKAKAHGAEGEAPGVAESGLEIDCT